MKGAAEKGHALRQVKLCGKREEDSDCQAGGEAEHICVHIKDLGLRVSVDYKPALMRGRDHWVSVSAQRES